MHQTFYIDADEEISSIIDRLNKSMSVDNYFIIPKRALFLQSIVNVKILKREADKMSKRVVLVTQDEIARSMADRSGIEVLETLDDDFKTVSNIYINENDDEETEEEDFQPERILHREQDKQERLSKVGSGEFYDKTNHHEQNTNHSKNSIKALNSKKVGNSKTIAKKIPVKVSSKVHLQSTTSYPNKSNIKQPTKQQHLYGKGLDPHKEQSLEKMFSTPVRNDNSQPKSIAPSKTRNIFFVFIFLCIAVSLGIGGYLYLPSAKIAITTNTEKKRLDMDLTAMAGSSTLTENNNIELRVIDKEQQVTLPYDISGQPIISGKKARGNVVIYNEYSTEPQTLIATTRIQSAEGKIFRLVKNVVVPGLKTIDGQQKPGAIEVEVVADQAGSDYNVDAGKFTIPGFADGPKFDKFYASSSVAMIGGSTDGDSDANGVVSSADLDKAKQQAELDLKEKLNKLVSEDLIEGEIVLPQAQKISITKSTSSVKTGTKADSFNWVAIGSVRTLVFSEKDVNDILQKNMNPRPDEKLEINKVDYGTAEVNFENPSLKLKVYGDATLTPNIDVQSIKNELLGKRDDQLEDVLRKYSSIKSANVEFHPSFISKIPQYSSRITVNVDN